MAPVQHRQREARRGLHHQLHRFSPGEEKTAEILSTQRLLFFVARERKKSGGDLWTSRHFFFLDDFKKERSWDDGHLERNKNRTRGCCKGWKD